MDNAGFYDDLSNSSSSTPPSSASPRTDYSGDEFAMIYSQSPSEYSLPGNNYDHSAPTNKPHNPFGFSGTPGAHPNRVINNMDPQPQYWASSSTESLPSQAFLSDLQSTQSKLDRLTSETTPELYYHQPPGHMSHEWSNYQHGAELREAPATLHDALLRRGSYPYVRSDGIGMQGYGHRPMDLDYDSAGEGSLYSDGLPLTADPSVLHNGRLQDYEAHSVRSVSEGFGSDHDVKEERSSPPLGFSRPGSAASQHSVGPPSLHQNIRVVHTTDAASKETQFLRRKCFNCHTTEPPSWRRSTLNPGKIVCNKCGLYERTHMRHRPPRFDELRCGSKVRKTTKIVSVVPPAGNSRSQRMGNDFHSVKTEDGQLKRRGSVGSPEHDGRGYSSAPSSAFGSPASMPSYPSRQSSSVSQDSEMNDSPIRLPQAPMATLTSPRGARKAQTSPDSYHSGGSGHLNPNPNYWARRGSLPTPTSSQRLMPQVSDARRQSMSSAMPPISESTGWLPMADMAGERESRK